ncbi:MAG: translocation and assembly module TamB, partial [Limisphaerales bacterium]
MATSTRFKRSSRKIILLCSRILAVMAFLLVLTYLVFLIPSVQSFAASKAADYLSRKSGTIVSIEKISVRPVKNFYFAGLYIQDYNGDTMLYSKSMNVSVKGFDPFRKSIQVSNVELESPLFTMHRPLGDSLFTFSKFLNSISSNKSKDKKVQKKNEDTKKVWQIALGGLDLKDALFKFEDVNAQTFF